jgi:hypothetical protein
MTATSAASDLDVVIDRPGRSQAAETRIDTLPDRV